MPPPAESPPASPATKRRRVHSGSGSGSNDGLEAAAAASPAPTPSSAAATAVTGPPADLLASGFTHDGQVKVEKIDIDITDDDEEDLAALGQVVDYEDSYDSSASLGAVPVSDPSQGETALAYV